MLTKEILRVIKKAVNSTTLSLIFQLDMPELIIRGIPDFALSLIRFMFVMWAEGIFINGRLSFWFAQKINAAGRLGDAGRAVKLLISENFNYALKVAKELENENLKRRDITERILIEAENSKIKITSNRSFGLVAELIYRNDFYLLSIR